MARGLRLRRGTCLLKGPAAPPAYFGKLRGQAEGELERLGFSYSHVQIVESPFVGPFTRKWVLVYANPVAGAAAEVTLADVPEPARPFAVTFVTYFSGRHRLMTVNGIRHGLVGTLPWVKSLKGESDGESEVHGVEGVAVGDDESDAGTRLVLEGAGAV